MEKAKSVKEFVERMDNMKKKNPKDLSSDQDLTIAIMNLISIEEHLIFSGAKTGKNSFYDTVQDVREMRKNLMLKIIPSYEGEVWCISKHLLATSMRLMEVGTKQQSMNNTKEAYDLFNQAYDLYCLFWGLNMNLVDTKDISWKPDSLEDVKKTASAVLPQSAQTIDKSVKETTSETPSTPQSVFGKMKAFVRQAVDCCIE